MDIYELTDVVDSPLNIKEDVVMDVIREEVRKIAQRHVPDIAAKIVREEIEKIKGEG